MQKVQTSNNNTKNTEHLTLDSQSCGVVVVERTPSASAPAKPNNCTCGYNNGSPDVNSNGSQRVWSAGTGNESNVYKCR